MLRTLDLFSGIGGFSLGLERTGGFKTVAFCEIDPYCRKVLKRHWPDVPIFEDVRTLTADALSRGGITVDVICGGFPCQDISFAGSGAGMGGKRSGLWSEYIRLVGNLRPRYIIVENVAALLGRGLDRVLGDLAAVGFDAEWHCIPASAVGAPHRRDRIWIVAYTKCDGREQAQIVRHAGKLGGGTAATCGTWESETTLTLHRGARVPGGGDSGSAGGHDRHHNRGPRLGYHWDIEPEMGRVVDGVPIELVADELRALGNAVVPQIPEMIGRAILEANHDA